ncbi:MAG: hypothetical protein ACJ73E_14825 [Mycobacteriales bacterium]
MSVERRIALARAALVVTGVLVALLTGWGDSPAWALPALAIASAITVLAAVRLTVRQQGVSFALNDAVLAVAFLLAPGGWIAVAMPLGYLLAMTRKRPWVKVSYNAAAQFCGAGVGALLSQQVGGGVLGACLGVAAFTAVNHLGVSLPIAITSGVSYRQVLVATATIIVVQTAGNTSVGVLAGWLLTHAPLALLGLIVPIGLLWWSYQQQTRRASEAQLFAELAQGQERVGGSVDASAHVITTATARLFGAAQVEMLLRHPDGLLRYVGDERGVSVRMRVDADALDAPWVLRALAARGIFVGWDGDRPFCSAVLGDPERPLAVLVAHRPERSAPFTRADAQLADVLVGQAESWLSVAEMSARHDAAVGRAEAYGAATRVLGDLGEETVPALAVLRESAHRLSRLATRFDGPDAVDEIVIELYSVERAVASLLGAIALASDGSGDPRVIPTGGPAGPARRDAEWTTTGRLDDAVGP